MLRISRAFGAGAISAALLLASAGCSGSSSPDPGTSPSSTQVTTSTSESATTQSGSATGEVKTNVAYAQGGSDHQLDLYYPAQKQSDAAGLVVFIHGGGWQTGDKDMMADGSDIGLDGWRGFLNKQGLVVASVNYRLSGTAPWPAQLHDVKSSIRYLRNHAQELGVDPTKVIVAGESAGAQLAQMVALTPGNPGLSGDIGETGKDEAPAKVISYYGVSDLPDLVKDRVAKGCEASGGAGSSEGKLLGGVDPAGAGRAKALAASPLHHVHAGAPPFLMFHGDQDCTVPKAQTVRMAAALKAKGVAVQADYIQAGHADYAFYHDPTLMAALQQFVTTG